MKSYILLLGLFLSVGSAHAAEAQIKTNPIAKVLELISNLQSKVIKEGEEEQKSYEAFAEWCEDEAKEKQFEIKTGKAEKETLEATIAKAAADIDAADTKIGELSAQIATAEGDLKSATEIRDKERADFEAEEKDLTETIDILQRAIGILEQEMAKHPAAFVQMSAPGSPAASLVQALKTLLEASSLSGKDKAKLAALIQTKQQDGDMDEEGEDALDRYTGNGAPDPAAYKGHSSGIIDVMNDMLEEAEGQLADSRQKEMKAQHAYELLAQSLKDEIKHAGQRLDDAKTAKAAAEETKATAEGDLAVCTKELEEDVAYLEKIHHDCMTQATEFEESTKSRDAELEALATAKKIIKEATEGSTDIVYSAAAASFLQLGSSETESMQTGQKVVDLLRKLADTTKSSVLVQLARAVRTAMREGAAEGEDPFGKVKGLIRDMIDKLLKEAEEEANHKAFCDEEMGKTKKSKTDLETTIDDLKTKIDKMNADIARLKEEVKTLQAELVELAKSQAKMDEMRAAEHEEFLRVKKELEDGIEGIGMALKVLREYYAEKGDALVQVKKHEKATGAASGIIGLLEVAEADFSKNLADATTAEETAQTEYEDMTKENEIAKATKEQDVKYKTKEFKGLEKSVADAQSDLASAEEEYKAVAEYWEKLQEECVAKPEPYEERVRRREAEIAGLKEALQILEGEAVLLQKTSRTRRMFSSRGGFLGPHSA